MPDNGPRYIERTKHYFIHADDIEAEPILSVEGPKEVSTFRGVGDDAADQHR